MKRLSLSLLFIISHLSFGFAQQSAFKMAGPYEVVARDGQYKNTKGGSERDMYAALTCAQSGDTDKALEIINAYAHTLQRFDGHDAPLCAIQSYNMVSVRRQDVTRAMPRWVLACCVISVRWLGNRAMTSGGPWTIG